MLDENEIYSWQFLNEMVGWAKYFAVAVALGGFYLTRDYRFLVAFAVGASFDILTLIGIIAKGKKLLAADLKKGGGMVVSMIALRLGVKAVLLAMAASVPQAFNLWGMVLGVLTVDTTILAVGSVKTALEVWR